MSEEPKRVHKVGSGTGYETDGTSYWLAPALVESHGEIEDQMRARDAIVKTLIQSTAEAERARKVAREGER